MRWPTNRFTFRLFGLWLALGAVGVVCLRAGTPAEELSTWSSGLAIFKSMEGTERNQALCCQNIAAALVAMGRYDEGIQYQKQALALFAALQGMDAQVRNCWGLIGDAERGAKRYPEAIAAYEKAGAEWRVSRGTALAHASSGESGDHDKAAEYLLKAVRDAAKTPLAESLTDGRAETEGASTQLLASAADPLRLKKENRATPPPAAPVAAPATQHEAPAPVAVAEPVAPALVAAVPSPELPAPGAAAPTPAAPDEAPGPVAVAEPAAPAAVEPVPAAVPAASECSPPTMPSSSPAVVSLAPATPEAAPVAAVPSPELPAPGASAPTPTAPDEAPAPVAAAEPAAPESRSPVSPPAGPIEGQKWIVPDMGMEFVWVSGLGCWVGKYETTNGEYRQFKPDHDSREYQGKSLNSNRQPVVYVTVDDAREFASWLTKREHAADRLPEDLRYRLPTKDEWTTFAECGDARVYPWGDDWPPKFGNYADHAARQSFSAKAVIDDYDDGFAVTCPVEQSGCNYWGLHGTGGNVWECMEGSSAGGFAEWRGASWDYEMQTGLRCSFRFVTGAANRSNDCGVRLMLSR